jgi:RNA polymerase sigma-70 factor (ECF subfamily)
MTSDADLVLRIIQKDPEAFAELLHRFDRLMRQATINVLCIKMTLSLAQEEAGDIVQEVLLDLWRNSGRDIDQSLPGYLRTMAYNKAINRIRKIRASVQLDDFQDTLLQREPNPEELTYAKEVSAAVRREISELSPVLRETLRRSMEEQPQQKIAEELNVARGTVKSRLNRAREILSERLDFEE